MVNARMDEWTSSYGRRPSRVHFVDWSRPLVVGTVVHSPLLSLVAEDGLSALPLILTL